MTIRTARFARSHVRAALLWAGAAVAVTVAPVAAQQPGPGDSLAQDGATSTPRVLRVTGTASVEVPADRVRLRFAVETEGTTAAGATQANAVAMDAALSAVRRVVDGRGTVATEGYRLTPLYRDVPREEGGGSRIAGYRATNHVSVVLLDLDLTGAVLDAATGAGVNRVVALEFGARDTDEARQRALADATGRARAEALAVAAALGTVLLEPLEVSIAAAPGPDVPLLRMQMVEAAAATPIEPGTQEVRASVTITWQLGGMH